MKNGIKIVIILFIVLSISSKKYFSQAGNTCVNCHVDEEILPNDFIEYDVHYKSGIFCEECHGGNPLLLDEDESMSKKEKFVGIPSRKSISDICGNCHSNINYMKQHRPRIETDQVERYFTSQHGAALLKGDENVAVCTSCHTAHGILSANDPRSSTYALNIPRTCNTCHGIDELMKNYNLETNVTEDYTKGVHGIALFENNDIAAPSCNDCHGNHGATPPGINSISNVCGMCHLKNASYFKESKMANAFKEMEFHDCEECHGNHLIKKTNDEMVGIGGESNCTQCHTEGEKGYDEAIKIYSIINNLDDKYILATEKLNEVINKGMNDIEIEFILMEAKQALIESRTLVHTFDSKRVGEKAEVGFNLSQSAIDKSNEEISDYHVRRNGFAIATLVITLLIIGLYFKSREISRKDNLI